MQFATPEDPKVRARLLQKSLDERVWRPPKSLWKQVLLCGLGFFGGTLATTGLIGSGDRLDCASGFLGGWLGDTSYGLEKTVVVVTMGRTGSSALTVLLNECINDAFVQGENDLNLWWLYKYALSVESYEVYSPSGRTHPEMTEKYFDPGMPFYKQTRPDTVEKRLRALVLQTLTGGERHRVGGMKEIRWIERARKDSHPEDKYWDMDSLAPVLRDYRAAHEPAERIAHFLQWLERFLPQLHVIVLTRNLESRSQSAWNKGVSAEELKREDTILLSLLRKSYLRSTHVEFESLRSHNTTVLASLFMFLGEPFDGACAKRALERTVSF